MIMYGSTTFFLLVTDVPDAPIRCGSPPAPNPGAGRSRPGSRPVARRWPGSATSSRRTSSRRRRPVARPRSRRWRPRPRPAEADGREDVLFLPYLSGERTPINDPSARGVVAGLSLHSTRGDAYRGLLQGIAYAARSNLEAMRALGAIDPPGRRRRRRDGRPVPPAARLGRLRRRTGRPGLDDRRRARRRVPRRDRRGDPPPRGPRRLGRGGGHRPPRRGCPGRPRSRCMRRSGSCTSRPATPSTGSWTRHATADRSDGQAAGDPSWTSHSSSGIRVSRSSRSARRSRAGRPSR